MSYCIQKRNFNRLDQQKKMNTIPKKNEKHLNIIVLNKIYFFKYKTIWKKCYKNFFFCLTSFLFD